LAAHKILSPEFLRIAYWLFLHTDARLASQFGEIFSSIGRTNPLSGIYHLCNMLSIGKIYSKKLRKRH